MYMHKMINPLTTLRDFFSLAVNEMATLSLDIWDTGIEIN